MSEYLNLDKIATFNQVNASNFQGPLNASEFTIQKLMHSIHICENERVQCSFTPMLSRSAGATKTELKPCYDSTIGTSSHCSQFSPTSICCSKHLERNKDLCPVNSIKNSVNKIRSFETAHPREMYAMKHAIKPISELNNFCLALTEYKLDNKIIYSGKYKMYVL